MIMCGSIYTALSSRSASTYSTLRAVAANYREAAPLYREDRRHRHVRRLYSNGGGGGMNVFDRKAKRWHKNRAAMSPDADTFDYLRDEVTHYLKPL